MELFYASVEAHLITTATNIILHAEHQYTAYQREYDEKYERDDDENVVNDI